MRLVGVNSRVGEDQRRKHIRVPRMIVSIALLLGIQALLVTPAAFAAWVYWRRALADGVVGKDSDECLGREFLHLMQLPLVISR